MENKKVNVSLKRGDNRSEGLVVDRKKMHGEGGLVERQDKVSRSESLRDVMA